MINCLAGVIIIHRYYNTTEQFRAIYARLKLHACPHCNAIGFLILHGLLYGYTDQDADTRLKRGHRIFCSNRNKKQGCGRTFSTLKAGFIKNCVITAQSIWNFLDKLKDGKSLAHALRQSGSNLKQSSVYRVFKTFKRHQSRIRTWLTRIKDPPQHPLEDPAILTIYHLKSVFKGHACPIAQFQYAFQVSFF